VAEWNTVPVNVSMPGTSGIFGVDSAPVAATNTRALADPCDVCTDHRLLTSSQVADRSSQFVTMRFFKSRRSTTERR